MSKNSSFRRRNHQRARLSIRVVWLIIGIMMGYVMTTLCNITTLGEWVQSFTKKHSPSTSPEIKTALHKVPTIKPKFEFYTLLSKDNSVSPTVHHSAAEISDSTPAQTTNKAVMLSEKSSGTPLELTMPVAITSKKEAKETENKHNKEARQVTSTKSVNNIKERQEITEVKNNKKDKSSNFLIQVAAFNKIKDAEHLKAALVLTGFNASISSTQRQNMLWYRVSIGPFVSLADAKKAQNIVYREEHMKGIIRQIG